MIQGNSFLVRLLNSFSYVSRLKNENEELKIKNKDLIIKNGSYIANIKDLKIECGVALEKKNVYKEKRNELSEKIDNILKEQTKLSRTIERLKREKSESKAKQDINYKEIGELLELAETERNDIANEYERLQESMCNGLPLIFKKLMKFSDSRLEYLVSIIPSECKTLPSKKIHDSNKSHYRSKGAKQFLKKLSRNIFIENIYVLGLTRQLKSKTTIHGIYKDGNICVVYHDDNRGIKIKVKTTAKNYTQALVVADHLSEKYNIPISIGNQKF